MGRGLWFTAVGCDIRCMYISSILFSAGHFGLHQVCSYFVGEGSNVLLCYSDLHIPHIQEFTMASSGQCLFSSVNHRSLNEVKWVKGKYCIKWNGLTDNFQHT